ALRPLFAACMGSGSGIGKRSTRHRSGTATTSSSNGTYELRSKNGVLHSKVEAGGEICDGARTRGSFGDGDNESKRSILGQRGQSDGGGGGGRFERGCYDGSDGERGEQMC
ncbi:hypothetical protein SLS58_009357, partial [Diplodia intermedia]